MNETRIIVLASLLTEEAMNFVRTHRIKDGEAIIVRHQDATKPKTILVCIGSKLFKFRYKSCINIIGDANKKYIEDIKEKIEYSLNVVREIGGMLHTWKARPSSCLSTESPQAAIFVRGENGIYICENRDIFFACARSRSKFEHMLEYDRDKFWISYFNPENYFKDYSPEDGTFIPLRQRIEDVSFDPKKDLVADSPLLVQYTEFPHQLEKYDSRFEKPQSLVATRLFYKSKHNGNVLSYNLVHKTRLYIPSDSKLEKRLKLGAYMTSIAECRFDTRAGYTSTNIQTVVLTINKDTNCYIIDVYIDTGYVAFEDLNETYPEGNKFGDKYREILNRWYGSGMVIFE